MSRPLVKTNAQALRWCRTRRAQIEFSEWKSRSKDITCRIKLGKRPPIYGKTLIKAVNAWIKFFNRKEGEDIE